MTDSSRDAQIQTACLLFLSAVAGGFVLFWLRGVMIPFVLALFFALGLAPLIDLGVRYLRVPRAVALGGVLVIAVVLLMALGSLVSTSIGELTKRREMYQTQVRQLASRVVDALPLEAFGIDSPEEWDPLARIPASSVGRVVLGTTNALIDIMSKSLLVLIFVIFLLLGGERGPPTGVWAEIDQRVRRYLTTKALLSGATGVLVATVLTVLNVDLALVFGLFAFLLNFIPSIGSVVATLLPLPVVALDPSVSPTVMVLAIALPGAIQLTIGNFLEPKIMGDALELHPVAILLMLIIWGMLWGIPGMLLATPITAVLKILFQRFDRTRVLADLLEGRLG